MSPSPRSSSSPSSPALRILALGDSYTIGESVSEAGRWPEQFASQLREQGYRIADVQIIARTGWTTEELGAAIAGEEPSGIFDLVTLLIGVNDQYRGLVLSDNRPRFRALLDQAVAFAGGRPDRVIVLSIPDWGVTPFGKKSGRDNISEEIDAYNRINQEETQGVGAIYLNITPISREAETHPTLVAGDGLHPSAPMYARWVEKILPLAIDALSS
jgi:lysophospholipase L1-like esterase